MPNYDVVLTGVSSKRIKGSAPGVGGEGFRAMLTNRWTDREANCTENVFTRGFAIIDTACIPADAPISSANFIFTINSRTGHFSTSVWVDDSNYPDNDNRWIIDPGDYPNNGIQLDYNRFVYGEATHTISVNPNYIRHGEGNHTRFILRYGGVFYPRLPSFSEPQDNVCCLLMLAFVNSC